MSTVAPTTPGIYAIKRRDRDDEQYIGSAVNIAKRWAEHRSDLRRGKHRSSRLQNVWTKHGPDAFEFVILEHVADKAQLIEREQAWLDRGTFPAYNTAKIAGSLLGFKHSPEARAKISASRMGNTYSLGCTRSAETRAKMSAASRGNTRALGLKQTPAHIAARVASRAAGRAAARARRAATEALAA